MLFTDTDSVTFEIKSEDAYEELFIYKHLIDFSEYQSKFFDPTNKIVTGKMKDEYNGKPICEFVGIKSKMHCFLSDDTKESNIAKRVNIAIEFNDCRDILFNKKLIRHKMRRIQSKKLKIGTYEVNKISLSKIHRYIHKRYILDDGVHTLAYFHKDLKK